MAQLAARDGLLQAADVDIVAIMLDPHEAVPGFEIVDLIGRGGMGSCFVRGKKPRSGCRAQDDLVQSDARPTACPV